MASAHEDSPIEEYVLGTSFSPFESIYTRESPLVFNIYGSLRIFLDYFFCLLLALNIDKC